MFLTFLAFRSLAKSSVIFEDFALVPSFVPILDHFGKTAVSLQIGVFACGFLYSKSL